MSALHTPCQRGKAHRAYAYTMLAPRTGTEQNTPCQYSTWWSTCVVVNSVRVRTMLCCAVLVWGAAVLAFSGVMRSYLEAVLPFTEAVLVFTVELPSSWRQH